MSDTTNITYDKLYDVLRAERSETALSKLPSSFFADVVSYLELKNKPVGTDKENSPYGINQSDATAQQLRNVRKILHEIYSRREKKISMLALDKSRTLSSIIDTGNLLAEENELFVQLVDLFTKYREELVLKVLSMKVPFNGKFVTKEPDLSKEEEKVSETHSYVVLSDIPEFIGPDMETYGPFAKDDLTKLSDDVAKLLLEQQKIALSK